MPFLKGRIFIEGLQILIGHVNTNAKNQTERLKIPTGNGPLSGALSEHTNQSHLVVVSAPF